MPFNFAQTPSNFAQTPFDYQKLLFQNDGIKSTNTVTNSKRPKYIREINIALAEYDMVE